MVRLKVGGCKVLEGGEVEYFKGAQPFVVIVNGLVIGKIKNQFKAKVLEESLARGLIVNDLICINEGNATVFVGNNEEKKNERIDEFKSAEVREERFKAIVREDDADAVLAKPLIEVMSCLLFPPIVLPEPLAGGADNAFLEEGQHFIHHSDDFAFDWMVQIGPNWIGVADSISSANAARGGKNNGTVRFIGEKGGCC